MNRVITATTLSLALMGTTLVGGAAGQAVSGTDPKLGKRVIITGCLHKGTSRNSFVLLGVTERPADGSASVQPVPLVIYWLDSTDGLEAVVGEMVDITGLVTERRSKPGTVTVAVDPGEALSTDVNIVSGTREVTTQKYDNRTVPTGTSGVAAPSSIEVTRPVYKLVVEQVRALTLPVGGPACR